MVGRIRAHTCSFLDPGPAALSNRTHLFVRTLVNLRLGRSFDAPVHESRIPPEAFQRMLFKLTAVRGYRAEVGVSHDTDDDDADDVNDTDHRRRRRRKRSSTVGVESHRFRSMLTDLGMCETFNSRLAAYLSAEFYVSGRAAEEALADRPVQTNALDAGSRMVSVAGVLEGSEVR